MKTISFELAKRLNDGGWLDNIDTEYYINRGGEVIENMFNNSHLKKIKATKTLTLDEAFDFIPSNIGEKSIHIFKSNQATYIQYFKTDNDGLPIDDGKEIEEKGKTLLEAIEKILEYLYDNNLLTK